MFNRKHANYESAAINKRSTQIKSHQRAHLNSDMHNEDAYLHSRENIPSLNAGQSLLHDDD
jgi:hypothetical protein